MSHIVYIEYAGLPIKLPEIVAATPQTATQYPDEVSAWKAVLDAGLTPEWCRVVNLSEDLTSEQTGNR